MSLSGGTEAVSGQHKLRHRHPCRQSTFASFCSRFHYGSQRAPCHMFLCLSLSSASVSSSTMMEPREHPMGLTVKIHSTTTAAAATTTTTKRALALSLAKLHSNTQGCGSRENHFRADSFSTIGRTIRQPIGLPNGATHWHVEVPRATLMEHSRL